VTSDGSITGPQQPRRPFPPLPTWRLRQYHDADFDEIARLRQEAFHSSSRESVRFSLSVPGATVFVAEARGTIVGTAVTLAFGQTAWIGGVVVTPAWQRRGIATALTERALEVGQARARTVLLLALGPARRLYEGLGFVYECTYGTWTLGGGQHEDRRLPASQTARQQASRPSSNAFALRSCLELDHLVTGEVREPYLRRVSEITEIALTRAGPQKRRGIAAAYAARLPWGAGPIISTDPSIGARLVRETLAADPAARIEFPDANAAGTALMSELGLKRIEDDYRMRVGPPLVGFHPEFVYRVLTPMLG